MKNFMQKSDGWALRFCLFLSHSSKNFRRGDPCVRKNFLGGSLVFWKCSGLGENYGKEEGYHVYPSKTFCLTALTKFVG